ncbi:alpha/beta hydrolase [Hymenobacter sp.]|jgi:pimeloyl-ACP methyl ester carboxylesterase|uniref:alpha/beta fold hydrolase n=1 Tax=Hymenobacter sp. TaxID=1898978 RepID=UPI002ED82FF8
MQSTSLSLASGVTVATYEAGNPAGGPVFFVHGNSFAADTFIRQFEAPELQQFRLVAIDLPGHGQSAWTPERYSLGSMRATVGAAVQALGLEQALAVGHSYGGNLLLELLPSLPALRGLIAIAPPLSAISDFAEAYPNVEARKLFFVENVSAGEVEAMARYALGPRASAEEVALLQAAVECADGRIRSELTASIAADLGDERGHVARTNVPLAFVAGELDETVLAPYFATLTAPSRWGPPLHRVPGTGHTPFLENPPAFNALLLRFADAVVAPGATKSGSGTQSLGAEC